MAFFASFVLDSSLVRQIIRWDMGILSESPWYQQILNEGHQQGLQAGREQGKQEEAVAMITRQLNRRFGSLSPELQERLRGLTLEQLEELSEVLLDFTAIAQLETWLQDQES
jgi:predicted transposase YdaD